MNDRERRFVFAVVWRGLVVAALLLVACSMATINKVDPVPHYDLDAGQCPMQCPAGCCALGGTLDGYQCMAPWQPGICQWIGVPPVEQLRLRDGGAIDGGFR